MLENDVGRCDSYQHSVLSCVFLNCELFRNLFCPVCVTRFFLVGRKIAAIYQEILMVANFVTDLTVSALLATMATQKQLLDTAARLQVYERTVEEQFQEGSSKCEWLTAQNSEVAQKLAEIHAETCRSWKDGSC